jgi:DNA helicase-2/ATP-dependent DNA helicase PcrA
MFGKGKAFNERWSLAQFGIDVDSKKSERDAKLLHVGCTRALHDLWLFWSGESPPLLKEVDKEL